MALEGTGARGTVDKGSDPLEATGF
jgi:hypothetical protein